MSAGEQIVNVSEKMVFIIGKKMKYTKEDLFELGFSATFVSDKIITGCWNDHKLFKKITTETLDLFKNGNAINIVNCKYIESYENEGLDLECINTNTGKYNFGTIYLTKEVDEDYFGENQYISFTNFHKRFKHYVDYFPSYPYFKEACAKSGFLFTSGFFEY